MKACIVGLGYIGLPTAITYALSGVEVLGVDIRKEVVDALNKGKVLIEEPEISERLEKALATGNLRANTAPGDSDAYFICVPTPLTDEKGADLSYVESAARSVAGALKKGDLVVLESTVPPGTTSDLLVPILEESGLSCEDDVFVAFCPERVMPGKIFHELVNNDRVIGGYTEEAASKAKEYYSTFVKGEIFITDSTTAEFVKLAENTFRDVNIALANEFAVLCEECGIDAWNMIRLANKHPRVTIHNPGPGVGGHCIAVDPWYLVERFGSKAQLIRLSREVNDSAPHRVVEKVKRLAPPGSRIAVLGMAYKGNIDDVRESPSLIIADTLERDGFEVARSDPYYTGVGVTGTYEAMEGADLILVLTDHEDYRDLDPVRMAEVARNKIILDTRNVIDKDTFENAGFAVHLIGRD